MRRYHALLTCTGAFLAVWAAACSSPDESGQAAGGSPPTSGSGGANTAGGASSGGSKSNGGSPSTGSGGSPASGGSAGAGKGGASAGAAGSGGGGGGNVGASGGVAGSSAGSAGISAGGSGGRAGMGGAGGSQAGAGSGGASAGAGGALAKFSFFVTGLDALVELAKNADGFGGDFRFGETTGLAGADKICSTIAEKAMPGASQKQWRAFLSTTTVNAIDRVGSGPWYDRLGRVLAMDKAALLAGPRPQGAASQIINDLPNESGQPNHTYNGMLVDNHDTVTGSDKAGKYDGKGSCGDWTNLTGTGPSIGHSWPRNASNVNSGGHWMSDHTTRGCARGIQLSQNGGGTGTCIGCAGGYGGIYCFALTP